MRFLLHAFFSLSLFMGTMEDVMAMDGQSLDVVKSNVKKALLDGSPEQALDVVKGALQESPEDIDLINFAGLTYVVVGDFEEAVPYLLESVDVDPVNTLKALVLAVSKVDDNKHIYVAMIPCLMNYRKEDSILVFSLIGIGFDLDVGNELYYKSVIDGCSLDSLMNNPDIREVFQKYPDLFFDENEIGPIFKKYGMTDRRAEVEEREKIKTVTE